ncbi:hypothetical protein MiSe_94610 [Microseira wollei NIES-4236]|uniref:Transposase n=1 Tax=Microseira wollei NIES-4236 TaxID=2530354 RepID=A0AAV3XRE4_9CYAN|nr:hypothetical protein MiSe_94610 [Microseira wollei NIES-4236]
MLRPYRYSSRTSCEDKLVQCHQKYRILNVNPSMLCKSTFARTLLYTQRLSWLHKPGHTKVAGVLTIDVKVSEGSGSDQINPPNPLLPESGKTT